jgi:thiol-disulfide isomerase/thioredoxin
MFLHRLGKTRAPEFPDDLRWLNSKELSLSKLKGKVVLIDFWTYSCINCVRTFPHLRRWHELYESKGLVIVGVHTPEFEFEKDELKLKEALAKYKIDYPVAMDNEYRVWNLYQNKWWPRKFLIDSNGLVVYDHIGEGGYAETEHAIQKALKEIGAEDLPNIPPDESLGGRVCYRVTPELYLGYIRGKYANLEKIHAHEEFAYTTSEIKEDEIPYLNGHFKIESEYIEHSRAVPSASEFVGVRYSAFGVNLVIDPGMAVGGELIMELDGKPLPEDMLGEDAEIVDGRSVIKLDKARVYKLINSEVYHKGVLRVFIKNAGVKLYAFTFNGCL